MKTSVSSQEPFSDYGASRTLFEEFFEREGFFLRAKDGIPCDFPWPSSPGMRYVPVIMFLKAPSKISRGAYIDGIVALAFKYVDIGHPTGLKQDGLFWQEAVIVARLRMKLRRTTSLRKAFMEAVIRKRYFLDGLPAEALAQA